MPRLPAVRRPARGWLRDRRGVGAVEFALIAPILLMLYLGGSEMSIGVTVNRKVQHAASTVNDLVTQAGTLSATEIKGIFNISTAVLAPYDPTKLKIKLISVGIDANGKSTVDWTCGTTGTTLPAKGSVYALPADLAALRSRHLVIADTRYTYTPVSTYVFNTKMEMGSTSYLDPRVGDTIASTGC